MKVLVIASHSYQEQSVSNLAIAEQMAAAGFEVRNLEQLYPDGTIDAEAERRAVEQADVLVFLHPIFWYSLTPMLKKWQDEVQAYGWAYGTGGDKMKGKKFVHVYTAGSPREAYPEQVDELLSTTLRASAAFTGMEFAGAFGAFGLLAMTNPNAREQAVAFAQETIQSIKAL